MKTHIGLLALAALGLSSGCSTIVSGTSQSIMVETKKSGAAIAGVQCKLTNDKGAWLVSTPASVTVSRSMSDMTVRCDKDGQQPGLMTVSSSTKGMVAGNVIFGGVIGVGVDVMSGAAYDYPSLFEIEMGTTVVIGPRQEAKSLNATAAPVTESGSGTAKAPAAPKQ